jgi:hypothetical protein
MDWRRLRNAAPMTFTPMFTRMFHRIHARIHRLATAPVVGRSHGARAPHPQHCHPEEDAMEIIGHPPELVGLPCESLICEGFVNNGRRVADANIVYLRFAGTWHKMSIDGGVVFWRKLDRAPEPWRVENADWGYPQVDVGAAAGIVGRSLKHYRMTTRAAGAQVSFEFDNGRRVAIENEEDRSTYRIS